MGVKAYCSRMPTGWLWTLGLMWINLFFYLIRPHDIKANINTSLDHPFLVLTPVLTSSTSTQRAARQHHIKFYGSEINQILSAWLLHSTYTKIDWRLIGVREMFHEPSVFTLYLWITWFVLNLYHCFSHTSPPKPRYQSHQFKLLKVSNPQSFGFESNTITTSQEFVQPQIPIADIFHCWSVLP